MRPRRPNLTIRISPVLYGEIKLAADLNGRSLSEEIERRLDRAAEWERMFNAIYRRILLSLN